MSQSATPRKYRITSWPPGHLPNFWNKANATFILEREASWSSPVTAELQGPGDLVIVPDDLRGWMYRCDYVARNDGENFEAFGYWFKFLETDEPSHLTLYQVTKLP